MRNRLGFGAALLAGMLVLTTVPLDAQDWKGRGRVQGRVLTEGGDPIEGAKITVFFGGDPERGPEGTTTNKKGRWSIGGLRNGVWTISIEKEGFVPSEGTTQVSELNASKPVTVSLRNLNDTEEAKEGREVNSWIDQANAAISSGRYAEARELYQKALPKLNEDTHPRVNKLIAQTYLQEGDFDGAANTLAEVLKSVPDDAEALKMTAMIKGQQGKTEEAISTLKTLIEVNPEDVESIRLIANILVAEGREDEAQAYIDKLPEGAGIDPNHYLNLGVEKYNSGGFDEAMGYFDKAIELDENLAYAYYFRALTFLAKGDSASAKADFEKLLEVAPDHEKAAETKEFLSAL